MVEKGTCCRMDGRASVNNRMLSCRETEEADRYLAAVKRKFSTCGWRKGKCTGNEYEGWRECKTASPIEDGASFQEAKKGRYAPNELRGHLTRKNSIVQ